MVDDLELQIAEFVLEVRHIGAADRIRDLIGFLDRIRSDRIERLFAIPFTAALRIAQPLHDLHQLGKTGRGVGSRFR